MTVQDIVKGLSDTELLRAYKDVRVWARGGGITRMLKELAEKCETEIGKDSSNLLEIAVVFEIARRWAKEKKGQHLKGLGIEVCSI